MTALDAVPRSMQRRVLHAAFSAEGNLLALALLDGCVEVWDMQTIPVLACTMPPPLPDAPSDDEGDAATAARPYVEMCASAIHWSAPERAERLLVGYTRTSVLSGTITMPRRSSSPMRSWS